MAPIHPGSWLGLPDLGLTEYLGSLLGVQQNPGTGGTGLSNILARRSNPAPYTPPRDNTIRSSTPQNFSSVLGAATSDSGSGGNRGGNMSGGVNPGPVNNVDNGQGAADLAFRSALANAQSYRDRGMQTFNDLLSSVGRFRDRAGELRSSGAQDITNTAANELGSNAKTAQQLAGSANAQGRNLGLSSKINLGQRIMGNLQGTQGSTLAAKGSNLRQNDNIYQGRLDQAQNQENEANQYRQGIESGVNQIQAGGLSDYSGALSNIVQRANALAQINPLNAGGLTAVSPDFSGVSNTLNGIMQGVGGSAAAPTPGADAGNLASDPSFQAYLKRYLGTYR